MWQTLTQMYGGSFLAAYGVDDAPPTVWKAALSKLTAIEAKQGIAALAKQGRSYPPNLTEVLEACRPKKLVRYLGVPTTPEAVRRLSAPLASDEQRQKYLAHMRSLFGPSKREASNTSDASERPGCTCKLTGQCDTCQKYATILDDVVR